MGFKITNIGNEPTKAFTLHDIEFSSAGGQSIKHVVNKNFHIDVLNPNQEIVVWVDELGTYINGQALIKLRLIPEIAGDAFETYQRDHFSKQISDSSNTNSWLDFIYVRSRTEEKQNENSKTMLQLNIVMAALTLSNIVLSYLQYLPIRYEQEKRRYDAEKYCQANQNGAWPNAAGGTISCAEILKM